MSYYAEYIIDEAKMSLAHGVLTGITESKVSFVSRDNLAAAAAGLLVGEGHDGAIYTGTGPESPNWCCKEQKQSLKQVVNHWITLTLPVETLQEQLQQAELPEEVHLRYCEYPTEPFKWRLRYRYRRY